MIKRHSKISKEYWKRMSREYYDFWCWQHSQDLRNMSPEKLEIRNKQWLDKINSKSDEELERIRNLKREVSLKRWRNMTPEDRKCFGDMFRGDNNYMRNITDAQKLSFSLKVREG